MVEIGTGLILAIGGAALLAALAFRHLIDTVVKLNDELQETIGDRHRSENEREQLRAKVAILEGHLAAMETRMEAQQREIHSLYKQLNERNQLIEVLQDQPVGPVDK